MSYRPAARAPWRAALSAAAILAVSCTGVRAQVSSQQYLPSSQDAPSQMFAPGSQSSADSPYLPSTGAAGPDGAFSGGAASALANSPSGSNLFQPGFMGESIGAGDQSFAIADNPGYIDSAVVRSRFRLRYDSAYGNNAPSRAEFFYPKCGCFRSAPGSARDPRASGPPRPGETNVNYQDVSPYIELAASRRFSAFIETPTRFLNPTVNRNTGGFADMNTGFKYAFVAERDRFYTFQFRTYIPTGNGGLGLGTNHVSLEPSLLLFRQLSDRLFFNGEVRDWIPIGGSNFAGNVIRYGLGLTYNAIQTDTYRIAPVNEFVGWTVLGGKESSPSAAIRSAQGDTIVNAKIGLRFAWGDYREASGSALNDRHSLYFGYARSLTDNVWYRNMIRVDYTFYF